MRLFVSVESLLFSLALALLAGMLAWTEAPSAFNRFLSDGLQQATTQATPEDIVIIAIDEASLKAVGKWPWQRKVHAELVDRLTISRAKAIAFDIVFADEDSLNPENDTALSEAIALNGRILLPVIMSELKQGGQVMEILPLTQFINAAAGLGHVHVEVDEDGICRDVFLKEGIGDAFWPHLSLAVHEFITRSTMANIPGQRIESDTPNPMTIARDYLNRIRFHVGPGEFTTISYIDLLEERVPLTALTDKIVFVGATAAGLFDTMATPLSSAHDHMQGVEVNANIFHSLRQQTLIQPISRIQFSIANAGIAFLLILVISNLRPRDSIFATVIGGALILAISSQLLLRYQVWLPPAASLIALALSYPMLSWLRLNRSMRFLREELNSIHAEPILLEEKPPLSQLHSGLRLMESFLPLKSWEIDENAEPAIDKAELWKHEKDRTSYHLQNNGTSQKIILRWDGDHNDWTAFTDDLVKPWNESRDKLSPRSDVVTQYIERLRNSHRSSRELRQFIFTCLSHLQDGVVVTSLSGRIVLVNDQAKNLLGDATDSHPDVTFLEWANKKLIVGTEPFDQKLKSLYTGGRAFQIEASTTTKHAVLIQGKRFDLENEQDAIILFTLTDISAIKEMERVRTETLNFVSHDLRSPLVSILALLENESDGSDGTLPTVKRYARRALTYTESFLHLARAESEAISFYECDLHAIIDNACEAVFELARKKSISINTLHCDKDVWVWGNGDLLERVVVNLLGNAIKYSESGAKITITLAANADEAEIAVRDEGIGIPADDLPHLFDSFRRGSSPSSRERAGAGLGLRFIWVTLQRHRGDIQVQSKEGEGSVFTAILPVLDEPEGIDIEASLDRE